MRRRPGAYLKNDPIRLNWPSMSLFKWKKVIICENQYSVIDNYILFSKPHLQSCQFTSEHEPNIARLWSSFEIYEYMLTNDTLIGWDRWSYARVTHACIISVDYKTNVKDGQRIGILCCDPLRRVFSYHFVSLAKRGLAERYCKSK